MIPLLSQWRERLEDERPDSDMLESGHNSWAGGIGLFCLSSHIEIIKDRSEEFKKKLRKSK